METGDSEEQLSADEWRLGPHRDIRYGEFEVMA